jgi:lipid-A-disaccharide synthase
VTVVGEARVMPVERSAEPAAMGILVSAGEPSADLHAAGVIEALRDVLPGSRIAGLGGPMMAAAGANLTARMEGLTTIGFTQVVRTLPAHARLLRAFRRAFDVGTDLALLTDYPGFHLRVAREAARRDVPVLYYIAPQLWAWGEHRMSALRDTVTHLAVILPFEEPFFAARGVPTTFVGHPLLDRDRPSANQARSEMGLAPSVPVLGLFPGSRKAEVRRLWPTLRNAAELVRTSVPDVEVVVAALSGFDYPGSEGFRLRMSDAPAVMAVSDTAICKSGTSTLEAALADTPTVICYRTDPVSYAIARRVVRCKHIGLVNLVAGRTVAPEYVQGAATAEALARHALSLLDTHGAAGARQREGFAEVRDRLGTPGASRRVAHLARELTRC